MTKKLLQFVDLEQETPLKRKTSKRREISMKYMMIS